jgi:hypothetical protein
MSVPTIYRLYRYDAANMAVTADFVRAASDEEAIASIPTAEFGAKWELWHGKRLVAQLESERKQA